jgi:hypothetical protein
VRGSREDNHPHPHPHPHPSSNEPSEIAVESVDNIPKSIRNKFYSNINNYKCPEKHHKCQAC